MHPPRPMRPRLFRLPGTCRTRAKPEHATCVPPVVRRPRGAPGRRPERRVSEEEPVHRDLVAMGMENENDQADRAISTGKLHTLLRVHTRPIDVVVFHGSDREYWF